eukprot:g6184.t1
MWVLLTARTASIVEPNERVFVDKLEPAEAEAVLRGAANLPADHRLCDASAGVREICGYTAMDIAFVGSWSSVRTSDNCPPKSSKSWAGAVAEITAQMIDVKGQAHWRSAVVTSDLFINRLAVLRTGFEYLGREDALAQELYVAFAVFPDGHSFRDSDAAVLLADHEDAAGPISILERRDGRGGRGGFSRALEMEESTLGPDSGGVAFTRQELGWCVLGGGRLVEAEGLFKQALQIIETKLEPEDLQVTDTLCSMGLSVKGAGRSGEAEGLFKRALKIREALGIDDLQDTDTLCSMGGCAKGAGRSGEAEGLFKRALEIKEAKFGPDDVEVAFTPQELGWCVLGAGRLVEAEEGLFKQALQIIEAKLGPDDLQVADTLYRMEGCAMWAGRSGEALGLFKRALEIR